MYVTDKKIGSFAKFSQQHPLSNIGWKVDCYRLSYTFENVAESSGINENAIGAQSAPFDVFITECAHKQLVYATISQFNEALYVYGQI